MKPNEIKKGLECCTSLDESECVLCPYHKDNDGGCVLDMSKDALAYINQLEAEVERLKGIINKDVLLVTPRSGKTEKLRQSVMLRAKEIKAEAIKEFAERLKNEIISDTAYGCDINQHSGYYDYSIKIGDIPEYIDDLVKEMVGDDK